MKGSNARLWVWSGGLSLGVSALCFWLWYDGYLRIDFNDQGRFHDVATGMVHTDSAFAWAIPAFALLLLGSYLLRRARCR